jgi:hypothetical protein
VKRYVDRLLSPVLAVAVGFALSLQALAQTDPLPSWNDGSAKQSILAFEQETTDKSSPEFVPPADVLGNREQ